MGFPSVAVIVCIDGVPAYRDSRWGGIIKVLCVGECRHGGVCQGGKLPDRAIYRIADVVERHYLPIIVGAVIEVGSVSIGGDGHGGAVYQVCGRVVGSQINFVTVHITATGNPAQLFVDIDVDSVVGRVGALSGHRDGAHLRRRIGKHQATGREDGIGDFAVGVVGSSCSGGEPVVSRGAVEEFSVGSSS